MEDINIDYFTGTAEFYVNQIGSADKSTYKGMFKIKCVIGPIQFINSDALYRKLLGESNPQYASDLAGRLAYAISQLKYRISDCPDWFKSENGMYGSEVQDNILLYVFDKCVEAEMIYREEMEKRAKEAKKEVVESVDEQAKAKTKEEVEDDLEDDLED